MINSTRDLLTVLEEIHSITQAMNDAYSLMLIAEPPAKPRPKRWQHRVLSALRAGNSLILKTDASIRKLKRHMAREG